MRKSAKLAALTAGVIVAGGLTAYASLDASASSGNTVTSTTYVDSSVQEVGFSPAPATGLFVSDMNQAQNGNVLFKVGGTTDTVTFASANLPSGVALDTTSGVLTASSAKPGTYTGIVVNATDTTTPATAIASETVAVQVKGSKTTTTTTTSAIGTVKNKYSGKCLDVPGTYVAGTKLQQWACNGNGFDQEWQLVTVKTGKHVTGQYLQAVNNSDTPVALYVKDSGKGSQLTLTSTPTTAKPSGQYVLFGDGLVMDDAGWSKANGAHIISWPKNGGTNQHWSLP